MYIINKQLILILSFLFINVLLFGQNHDISYVNKIFFTKNHGKYLALESCISDIQPIHNYAELENNVKYILENKGKICVFDKREHASINLYYNYFSDKTCCDLYFAFNTNHWDVFDDQLNKISKFEYEDVLCNKHKTNYLFKNKGKWGIINIYNKIIVKPKYESLQIVSDSLLFFKKKKFSGIITMNGEILFKSKKKFSFKKNIGVYYLKQFKKTGVIINDSLYFKPRYDQVKTIKLNSNKYVFLVKKDNNWYAHINKDKILPIGTLHYQRGFMNTSPLYKYNLNGKWGIINKDNNKLIIYNNNFDEIDVSRNYISFVIHPKHLKVRKNKLWGLIDLYNNILIDIKYDDIIRYSDNRYIIIQNGKWGIVNNMGEEIIKPIYNGFKDFKDSLFICIKNKNYCIVDYNGKNYYSSSNEIKLGECDKKSGYCYFSESKKKGVITTKPSLLIKPQYNDLKYVLGGENEKYAFILTKSSAWKNSLGLYYDDKVIVPVGDLIKPNFSYNNKFFLFKSNNNFGIVTIKNRKIILGKPKYQEIKYQKDIMVGCKTIKKPLLAKLNNKWGLIDYNENIEIDFIYDIIKPYKNEKYIVNKNNLWGLIDNKGNNLCDIIYSSLSRINDKYIKCNQNGKYGIIDSDGFSILKPTFDEVKYLKQINNNKNFVIVKRNEKYGIIDLDYSFQIEKSIQQKLKNLLLESNPNAIFATVSTRAKTLIPLEFDKVLYFPHYFKNRHDDYFLTVKKNKFNIYQPSGEELSKSRYTINRKVKKGFVKILFENNDYLIIDENGKILSFVRFKKK